MLGLSLSQRHQRIRGAKAQAAAATEQSDKPDAEQGAGKRRLRGDHIDSDPVIVALG